MYEGMGYPPEQVDLMESLDLTRGFSTMLLVSLLAILLFFAWLGRYFVDRETV